MNIGPYRLDMPVLLAPMAGITDLPFRHVVRGFGVGMTVAEMVSANPDLQQSRKHRQRRVSLDEPLPRAIQIVGSDPREMAAAAALNEDLGAGIIDINMGCPAKKVCKKAAGSALLGDEIKVQAILQSVVAAVKVPVTLKIRTGLTRSLNNALSIARIAEAEGIQSLVVHGRSRACLFKGEAEYETVKRVKKAVSIPVVVNGDIRSPQQARRVLKRTAADAVMIGR
ncbi:MAG: tRNA dihydrouridine synthase DusB, partial [Proteobacteria bacterium]|nr:tRNA dihydrouridine synthase DusB [Pseudomonadota bacterium]